MITDSISSPPWTWPDTELEVDVVPLEALAFSSQKETRALELDGPSLLGQVTNDQHDYYVLACPRSLNFRIFVKILSGDADLFVSKKVPKPSVVDNSWFSVEKGKGFVLVFFFFFLVSLPISFFWFHLSLISFPISFSPLSQGTVRYRYLTKCQLPPRQALDFCLCKSLT